MEAALRTRQKAAWFAEESVMDNIITFARKEKDAGVMVFGCDSCGSDTFILQVDGYVHCAACNDVMTNLTVVEDE